MRFITQLTGLCMAVASFASMAAQASPVEAVEPRDVVTVTVYDEPRLTGEGYTPSPLLPGINTLPEEWWDRVTSLEVSDGWYCLFFNGPQGEGEFVVLQGKVEIVPPPFLRDIASFRCRRGIYITSEN